jgi:hypothetical protein
MAIEGGEQAGQGGVGGELIAGMTQEQGARVGVLKPFDVLQRARVGARESGRLAANRDDQPEALDRGQLTKERLGRGGVLAPGRLQIVENGQGRLSGAGGAAAIFASNSEAAPDAGRPRWVARRLKRPSAFGAGSRLMKNRRSLPKRSMTRAS